MERIKAFIIKNKKYSAVIFAILGILLIIISSLPKSDSEDTLSSRSLYGRQLEEGIKEVIEQITGKNTTKIMITFKNTYIQEHDSTGELISNKIKSQNKYESIPLPDIAGVMIVCTSLESKEDFLTIKKAVATCLDIPQSKIYIIGGAE